MSGDSPAAFPRKGDSPAGTEAFGASDHSQESGFIEVIGVPKRKTQLRNEEKRGTEFREAHGKNGEEQPAGAALVKSYLDALTASGSTGPEARPRIVEQKKGSGRYGGSFSKGKKRGHSSAMAANQNRSPDIKPSRPALSAQGTQGRKRPDTLLSQRLSAKDSGQYFPLFPRKPESGPSEDRQFLKSDHVPQSRRMARNMEGLAAQKPPMKTGIQDRTDGQNGPDGAITELIERAFTSRLKPAEMSGKALPPDLVHTVRSALPSGPEKYRKRRQQAIRDCRSVSEAKLSGGMSAFSTHSDVFQDVISPSPFPFPGSFSQESGGMSGNQKEQLLEALVANYWERRKGESGRIRTTDSAEMNEKTNLSATLVQKRADHLTVERNTGGPEIIARSRDEEGESPEVLSRKIEDILIEQARRYGIDL
ncbi:hypothetical protein [Desulfonema ishimotonii]|uniref:hypothetical protein n=1 Tax=Desulfonema ishimotonii TaxID=45657 RepID=UPI000F55C87A|nr:hypothetical protein [Desulfonema ishimotonii]